METMLEQASGFPSLDESLGEKNLRKMVRDAIDRDRPLPTHWTKFVTEATGSSQPENSYAALAEEEEEETLDDDPFNSLNTWAVKVTRRSRRTDKSSVVPKPQDQFVIKSEQELDALLAKRLDIAAISDPSSKLKKTIEALPEELRCGPNEVLCFVDSGSTVNPAWISKHFPQFAHLVESTPASRRRDSATTACGKKLFNKGRCAVYGQADGQDFPVAFKDMEGEMPILSVRKMVKRNNDIDFWKGGGIIRNRTLGKTVRFHEFEGVYYLKLKLDELSGGHGEDVEGWDNIDDADVLRDPASAEIGSDVFMDEMSGEDGSISQVPVGVPGPRTPTKAEVHKHNLKHIYYRGWCPHCLAGRRQNSQHKSQH